MQRDAATRIAIVLVLLIVWSLATVLRVRNPDPPIPRLALDARVVDFASAAPRRQALYRLDAVRYALAPIPVVRERPPRREWLVTDGLRIRGYVVVRELEGGYLLLHRR